MAVKSDRLVLVVVVMITLITLLVTLLFNFAGRVFIDKNPVTNFAAFAQAFDEHYAFFDDAGGSWPRVTAKFSPRVTSLTNDSALFSVFSQMITPLLHVSVATRNGLHTFNSRSARAEKAHRQMMRQQLPRVNEAANHQYFGGHLVHMGNIQFSLFQPNSFVPMPPSFATRRWGYINIVSMRASVIGNSVAATHYYLDSALESFGCGVAGVVLDLRYTDLDESVTAGNSHGVNNDDAVARAIVSHFLGSDVAGYRTTTRIPAAGIVTTAGWHSEEHHVKQAVGRRSFSGEVIVLQSSLTRGAAELVSLMLGSLRTSNSTSSEPVAAKRVRVIGERSAGAVGGVSNAVRRGTLPNGWTYSIPKMQYARLPSDGNRRREQQGMGMPVSQRVSPVLPPLQWDWAKTASPPPTRRRLVHLRSSNSRHSHHTSTKNTAHSTMSTVHSERQDVHSSERQDVASSDRWLDPGLQAAMTALLDNTGGSAVCADASATSMEFLGMHLDWPFNAVRSSSGGITSSNSGGITSSSSGGTSGGIAVGTIDRVRLTLAAACAEVCLLLLAYFVRCSSPSDGQRQSSEIWRAALACLISIVAAVVGESMLHPHSYWAGTASTVSLHSIARALCQFSCVFTGKSNGYTTILAL
jgi:hypothetical protein